MLATKPRLILICLVFCFVFQKQYGQTITDTAFVNAKLNLYLKLEIILFKDGNWVIEKHSNFKGIYALDEEYIANSEIVDQLKSNNTLIVNSKEYYPYSLCDSAITKVRNSSAYNKMVGQVYQEFTNCIGMCAYVTSYVLIQESNAYFNLCPDDFMRYKQQAQNILFRQCDSLYQIKRLRLSRLSDNIDVIRQENIDSFLVSFHVCDVDLEALSIIIEKKTDLFIKGIDNLNDTDYYILESNLFYLQNKEDKSMIKRCLRKSKIKSTRKNAIIRIMRYP